MKTAAGQTKLVDEQIYGLELNLSGTDSIIGHGVKFIVVSEDKTEVVAGCCTIGYDVPSEPESQPVYNFKYVEPRKK